MFILKHLCNEFCTQLGLLAFPQSQTMFLGVVCLVLPQCGEIAPLGLNDIKQKLQALGAQYENMNYDKAHIVLCPDDFSDEDYETATQFKESAHRHAVKLSFIFNSAECGVPLFKSLETPGDFIQLINHIDEHYVYTAPM